MEKICDYYINEMGDYTKYVTAPPPIVTISLEDSFGMVANFI
jgi:hypothetical protein